MLQFKVETDKRRSLDGELTLVERKNIESRIDWAIIGQLSKSVLNISKMTFEIKKWTISVIGIIIPLCLNFIFPADNRGINIDGLRIIDVVTLVLVLLFWLIDIYMYKNQETLRRNMDGRFEKIRQRSVFPNRIEAELTLPKDRLNDKVFCRALKSTSMFYLPLLIICIALLIYLFLI